MAPERKWWEHSFVPALIAAAAGILGVGLGAIATYYGNRSLQENQSAATARGIARVLSLQFEIAEYRTAQSVTKNRVIVPDAATRVSLPMRDEQLLASNLSFDAWAQVARTLSSLRGEEQLTSPSTGYGAILEADAGRQVALPPPLLTYERGLNKDLHQSLVVLRSLSEG